MSKDYFEGKEKIVSDLIRKGCTSGHHPHWQLIADKEILIDDCAIEDISRLVSDGYVEGYYPRWEIKE